MKRQSYIQILYWSMGGSFFTAYNFIFSIFIHTSPNDEARQEGLFFVIDPFVLTVAVPVAATIGLVMSLPLFWFLRDKNLIIVFPIIQSLVLIPIYYLQPINENYAIAGAGVVLLASAFLFYLIPVAKLK